MYVAGATYLGDKIMWQTDSFSKSMYILYNSEICEILKDKSNLHTNFLNIPSVSGRQGMFIWLELTRATLLYIMYCFYWMIMLLFCSYF